MIKSILLIWDVYFLKALFSYPLIHYMTIFHTSENFKRHLISVYKRERGPHKKRRNILISPCWWDVEQSPPKTIWVKLKLKVRTVCIKSFVASCRLRCLVLCRVSHLQSKWVSQRSCEADLAFICEQNEMESPGYPILTAPPFHLSDEWGLYRCYLMPHNRQPSPDSDSLHLASARRHINLLRSAASNQQKRAHGEVHGHQGAETAPSSCTRHKRATGD